MPAVSVIIPNYNHSEFLKQRIESVLNQSFQDFELIILDDCSTDGSKFIIEQYRTHPLVSRIKYNTKNSGSPFIQWGHGFKLAKGEYIWIAESDDHCSANFLKCLMQKASDSSAELLYSRSIGIDSRGQQIDNYNWWYKDFIPDNRWDSSYCNDASDEKTHILTKKNTIINASAVIFKNIPEIHVIVDEVMSYKFCGDWLFWIQYLSKINRICYTVDATNYFRTHDNTSRRREIKGRNNELVKVMQFIYSSLDSSNKYQLFEYHLKTHIYIPPQNVVKKLRELIILLYPYPTLTMYMFRFIWRRYILNMQTTKGLYFGSKRN